MIVVRNTFQIHPGQMKQAVMLVREGRDIVDRLGFPMPRFLTDVTGEFFTLVMETQFASLTDFEERLPRNFADPAWQEWFQKFSLLVRGGHREIFRVLD